MRIRLMDALNAGCTGRQTLTSLLGTTPQNVSKHLDVLCQAGLVSKHLESGRTEFEMVDWAGWWLVERAAESLGDLDVIGSYRPTGRSGSTA